MFTIVIVVMFSQVYTYYKNLSKYSLQARAVYCLSISPQPSGLKMSVPILLVPRAHSERSTSPL